MTFADSAVAALAVTAVGAVLALVARALTPGGAAAGAIVGACVSVGFGLPGLAVLGTFFVVGTLATRVGWEKKKARGTAEAGEGRRDAKRVLGKGGVAAALGLLDAAVGGGFAPVLFTGAVAAALADTLGTEIGVLRAGDVRTLPGFKRVPVGTPGAVSSLGTAAAAIGALLVAGIAWLVGAFGSAGFADPSMAALHAAFAGLGASLVESVAVGLGIRAPGFVRNLLTTFAGALLAGVFCAMTGMVH